MTEHDNEIEQILRQYRPAGPTDELRQRILSSAKPATKQIHPWRVWGFRAAIAAVVLIAVGLRLAPIIFIMATVLAIPGKGF